jgi:hypothetical protein
MPEPFPTTDDIVRLTQRLHAFFSHLDERHYEALAAMFLPDGRWLRQGRWFQGRAAIVQALQARPATMRVRHVISNVHVAADGAGVAKVDAYMTAYRQLEGQAPSLFTVSTVANTFRREQGEWMLAEQQLVRDLEFDA